MPGLDPISAGLSLIPSVFQGISAIGQKRKANKINPINPNFEMNKEVIDNARVLGDRATNYEMPGYGQAQNNINQTATNAFSQGTQSASSSGDVLDLISKIQYGSNQANNQLATQNAQGAEQAKLQSLEANAQAGQQYQDKNAYDREQYQARLREKAALIQASNENAMGALNAVGTLGTNMLSPKKSA